MRWVNIAENQAQRLHAAEVDAKDMHKALTLAFEAKVFWQKQCYLLAHYSEWERGVPDDDSARRSNVVDFYNHGGPCPPPAVDGPGHYERNPRYPCESTDNDPPDAWRPFGDSQPALTCHLRDGFIVTMLDYDVAAERMTFHRDLACPHVRAYIAQGKHRRPSDHKFGRSPINENPNFRFMIPCRSCFPSHRHHDIYHFDPVQLALTFQRILYHAIGQINEVMREHPLGYCHGATPRECQAMIPRLCAYVGVTTRDRNVRDEWHIRHTPRLHMVPGIRVPPNNVFYFESNSNFLNIGAYGPFEISACRPVSWFMATRPFAMLNRAHIEHADDIVYVSTWAHVHPPLALPGDLRQERATYDSDRVPFDSRRNIEYWNAWRLIEDDSRDNWSIDRVEFVLMDPANRVYGSPPARTLYKIPFFTLPVPASCQIMLEECADTFLGHGRQEDGEMLSFHYFHPNVEEALMYPALPIRATGRPSLEWYQVLAMRYRNPAVAFC